MKIFRELLTKTVEEKRFKNDFTYHTETIFIGANLKFLKNNVFNRLK